MKIVSKIRRQGGTLSIRKDMTPHRWHGRWHIHIPQPDGRFRVRRKSAILGTVDEMSRLQAEEELKRRHMLSQSKFGSLAVSGLSKGKEWFAGNPLVRGAVAELLAAADLMCTGGEVFANMNATGSCDLILYSREPRMFLRIEVKSGKISPEGLPLVEIESKHGKFDVLAVVQPDGAVKYFNAGLQPATALCSTRSILALP